MQCNSADRLFDIGVTLLCWLYFTLGFLLFFSPWYIVAALFSSRPEQAFQRYNRNFYRGFFALLRGIAPRQQWVIDERIQGLRSSVIVCNHLSYLDPLLLIARLDRSKTVVKTFFFSVPILGWLIRTAGFLPAKATGRLAALLLTQMESMEAYLAGGGNLFIFPEGTRRRDGTVGALSQGALKIARQCRVPVQVLCLHNTDKLFTPGVFFFSTRKPTVISVRLVDQIMPDEQHARLPELGARIRQALECCLREIEPPGNPNRELASTLLTETEQ